MKSSMRRDGLVRRKFQVLAATIGIASLVGMHRLA